MPIPSIYDGVLANIDAKFGKLGAREAVEEYVAKYLSRHHVGNPGTGCVMAALGGEASREDAEVQNVFADGAQRFIDK